MKNNNYSTKKLIIEILGNRFPLNLNQIVKEIKTKKNLSYQAVHKAISELCQENTVKKIEKQYFLDKDWVESQTKSFSKYYSNYFNTFYNSNQIDPKAKIQVFRFSSLKEILDFVVDAIQNDHLNKKESNKIYISLRRIHPIIPPSLIIAIKKLSKENKIYLICKSDKFTDKWGAKFFRTLGVKVKTGVDIPHQNIACFEDCVLQYFLFFDESYKKKVHAFSDKFDGKATINMLKLTTEIFYKKADMYMVLNRYPVFVKDIKETIAKEFE
jgi:hypothetical protein